MPNPVWPSTLPQFVEIPGYDETLPFPIIRTAPDMGPAKQRREFTSAPTTFSLTTDVMTAAQQAIFEAFYFDTLQHGSLAWDWVHPRTQSAKTFRFTGGPKPVPASTNTVRYRLSLEALP